ncbi:MAG TPA: hypothetical protein VHW09_29530 [Bryobacteraceae bacterium]|jgi:hypothetical protein|nr:hypothetical protein [Bryobacteraceae bacterium]
MSSHSCSLKIVWWPAILGYLAGTAAFGQMAPRVAPVPPDPLELATGPVELANTPESRDAALQLLARARQQFALRSTSQAFDLKASFHVNSQGQTNHDGAWQMEDVFVPKQGHRWTATSASGYTTVNIAANGKVYGDAAADAVPLRLLEARGVLFDPLQSPSYAGQGVIRTASAMFHGAAVTCLLLSRSRTSTRAASGRDWEETEECIDPQSGLLQVHSEVPGRYAVYDYSQAPQFANRILPHTVTVSEAGRVVSRITIESLGAPASSDPSLFVPSDAMKARGEAVAMTSATKVTRFHGEAPFTSAMTVHTVCVLGMVTAAGNFVEAHVLQPSDPNAAAALDDATKIDYAPQTPAGAPPRQHFAFVIEKFVSK